MKAPINNAGPQAKYRESREDMLELLDRLPAELRIILIYAPFNYAVRPWYRRWIKEQGVFKTAELQRRWVRRVLTQQRRKTTELYGPTHPQAVA